MPRPFMLPATRLAAVFILLGACLFAGSASGAESGGKYLLGPQDQIRLKVYEWRATTDQIFEWKALTDVYTVGPDGLVSIPFAGRIDAAGLTAHALALKIGDRLKQQMQLAVAPNTSVEIVQYRPFFVVGDVKTPGAFPYRPELTVLQALSIAGGLRYRADDLTRIQREMINGQGDINVLSIQLLSLVARKARLEAELADADSVTFPKQLLAKKDNQDVALAMQQERSIFKTRRDGLKTQVRALDELKDFLTTELATLKTQLGFHDKQISLIQKELDGISALVKKGYAAAPRQIALESNLARLQSERLTAETNLLQARQEISKTEIAVLDLRNKYVNEVTGALRDTQSAIDQMRSKAQTAVRLLQDLQLTAPLLIARSEQATEAQPTYTIVRTSGGHSVTIKASEQTPVEPGDTVKIERPPLPGLDILNAVSSAGTAATTPANAIPAAVAATGSIATAAGE